MKLRKLEPIECCIAFGLLCLCLIVLFADILLHMLTDAAPKNVLTIILTIAFLILAVLFGRASRKYYKAAEKKEKEAREAIARKYNSEEGPKV
jgi:hypothetical protein